MIFTAKKPEGIIAVGRGGLITPDDRPMEFYQAVAQTFDLPMTDILPVKYWLASVGSNKNMDYFGQEELEAAHPTIALKPININHARDKQGMPLIHIGVTYGSTFEENPETGKMAVLARAVLFTYLLGQNKQFAEITAHIENGDPCFSSMECVFTKFMPVDPNTGEADATIKTEKELDLARKAKTAARRFLDPLFTSSAFLTKKVPPADPGASVEEEDIDPNELATIFQIPFGPDESEDTKTKDTKEEEDDSDDNAKCEDKDKKQGNASSTDPLQLARQHHMTAHAVYSRIAQHGRFRDWDMVKVRELHAQAVSELEALSVKHDSPLQAEVDDHIARSVLTMWLLSSEHDFEIQGTQLATLGNYQVTCNSTEAADSLKKQLPFEAKGRVDFVVDPKLNGGEGSHDQIMGVLTTIATYLKTASGLGYNQDEALFMGISAHMLSKDGIDCKLVRGSIETAGHSSQVWWIESGGCAYRIESGEVWYADATDRSEHVYLRDHEAHAVDTSSIRTLIAEAAGDKVSEYDRAVGSDVLSDIPEPMVVSAYAVESVDVGKSYVWQDLGVQPSILWKVGERTESSGAEVPQAIKKGMAQFEGDTAFEGYVVAGTFHVYDVLSFGGKVLMHLPYEQRVSHLVNVGGQIQQVDFLASGTEQGIAETVAQNMNTNGVIIRDAASVYGMGTYRVVPQWFFELEVGDIDEGVALLLEGEVLGIASQPTVAVETGDTVTVSCEAVVQNDNFLELLGIQIVGKLD